MNKLCILLVIALLLCVSTATWAEDGVNIEVIKMDGVSVVLLTPEATMLRARGIAMNAKGMDEKQADFVLPQFLTLIEENAFYGIAATSVEVSEKVAAIEARAFADCKSLREITIPASVKVIDDHAFDGCEGVTVYGEKGTEAERIANLCGFTFVDPNAEPQTPGTPSEQRIPSAPLLPPVPFD